MNESEWTTATNPSTILNYLSPAASDRKLRLFACACCRLVWDLLPDGACRRAVEVSEQYADDLASRDELQRAWTSATRATAGAEARLSGWNELTAAEAEARDSARSGAWNAAHSVISDATHEDGRQQCALLRDIFNPFHPLVIDPAWQTPEVVALAQAMYKGRDSDRMPELANALAAAGCKNADVLEHCQRPGPHVRGCWVIDLLAGRQ